MAKVIVTEGHLEDIASAIRTKNGSTDTYRPGDMAATIQALDTSGIHPTGTKQITENGTHDVTDYAGANVAVPNSYSASDEGKVVSNGALVAQTSRTVTENGTYDTTENNSVSVNVSGGGGGSDVALTPYMFDCNTGYVNGSTYYFGSGYSDVYEVENGKTYCLSLGQNVGNRFRCLFTNTDVTQGGAGTTSGTSAGTKDNPIAFDGFVAKNTGNYKYLVIGKSNQNQAGIKTYVYCLSDINQ